MKQLIRYLSLLLFWISLPLSADWFEEIKATATDEQLHQLLYEMPKGGDLHHHLTGSILPEWWYELALADAKNGYQFYTKVKINNCRPHGGPGFDQYLIHYQNILAVQYEQLSDCEKAEYLPLADLDAEQKAAWMNSIRLDKPHEGRNEFFQKHWQRLGPLTASPTLGAEILLKNTQAFAEEGMIYLEPQISPFGVTPQGEQIDPLEVAAVYRARLDDEDFKATGVELRFQTAILRFMPDAEEQLARSYAFVAAAEPWVGVNMVGREDDDKGYPARFLPKIRELRRQYSDVRLSIHGGEVDEPNDHVRDTLLLGADRIGHGLNLITDPDAMRLMRHGPYMVEINLISNLLLEYVDDYSQHPFPEYLRIGIPVALSTDDRGMWDSTMTDEYFVAVKEFNVSWDEIRQMGENSLKHAFVDDETEQRLLERFRSRLAKFEKRMQKKGLQGLGERASPKFGFICRQYQLCAP